MLTSLKRSSGCVLVHLCTVEDAAQTARIYKDIKFDISLVILHI